MESSTRRIPKGNESNETDQAVRVKRRKSQRSATTSTFKLRSLRSMQVLRSEIRSRCGLTTHSKVRRHYKQTRRNSEIEDPRQVCWKHWRKENLEPNDSNEKRNEELPVDKAILPAEG